MVIVAGGWEREIETACGRGDHNPKPVFSGLDVQDRPSLPIDDDHVPGLTKFQRTIQVESPVSNGQGYQKAISSLNTGPTTVALRKSAGH
jgi:hypothetical protein